MLDFSLDNIFVTFGGRVFHRLLAFQWEPIEPLVLPTSFFYYNEAGFIQELPRKKILSLNNSEFGYYVEHIYLYRIRQKGYTDTVSPN